MCAECSGIGPVTCASVGRGKNCGLRFIYCLQPHGSDIILDPPLIAQARFGNGTDSEVFVEGFVTQNNTMSPNSSTANTWNRPNPYTRKLRSWPVSEHYS